MGTLSKSKILKAASLINAVLIVATILLALVGVGLMVGNLASPGIGPHDITYVQYGNAASQVKFEGDAIEDIEDLGSLRIRFKSRGFAAWSSSILAICSLLFLYILFNLRRFLSSTETNDVLSVAHTRYVKRIGYAAAGMVLYYLINKVLLDWYILSSIAEPIGISPLNMVFLSVSIIGLLLFAFLMVAMGEVFRTGAEMKEEQALTI